MRALKRIRADNGKIILVDFQKGVWHKPCSKCGERFLKDGQYVTMCLKCRYKGRFKENE